MRKPMTPEQKARKRETDRAWRVRQKAAAPGGGGGLVPSLPDADFAKIKAAEDRARQAAELRAAYLVAAEKERVAQAKWIKHEKWFEKRRKEAEARIETMHARWAAQKQVVSAAAALQAARAVGAQLSNRFKEVAGRYTFGTLAEIAGQTGVYVLSGVKTGPRDSSKLVVLYIARRLTSRGKPSFLGRYHLEEVMESDIKPVAETDPQAVRYRRHEMRARLAGVQKPLWKAPWE